MLTKIIPGDYTYCCLE